MARLFESPIIPNLRTIFQEIKQGGMLIPDFQRPFVWHDEQRLNLLDSIAKGYPIGSLLLWKTVSHTIKTKFTIGPYTITDRESTNGNNYIIDGHQRLATLLGALLPPSPMINLEPNIQHIPNKEDGIQWMIAIEIKEEEVKFIIPNKNHIDKKNIYPAWILMNNHYIYKAQKKLWDLDMHKEADALERLSNQFKDYLIPIMPMITDDLDVVLQAFARINNGGTSMDEVHLTTALFYEKNPLFGPQIITIESKFLEQNWAFINKNTVNSALKIRFNIDVYKKNQIKNFIEKINSKHSDQYIKDAQKAFDLTITLFESWDIYGGAALIYRYQIILLAELIRQNHLQPLNDHQAQLARRWFHQTSLLETFTGATSSRIRNALEDLKAAVDKQQSPMDGGTVPLNGHHKWGSVRTNTRLFVQALHSAQRDNKQALKDLSLLGNAAVHKLSPALSTTEPSSYIICSPEANIDLRRWLQQPNLNDEAPIATAQLHPDALQALRRQDLDAFQRHQRQHLRDLEADFIRANGLTPEPDEDDA
jgi:hypothetical protein